MKQKFYIDAKVKKIDKDIKLALKKANIVYPHHSLAFFKATYAKFEEANANKVILADSVKDDVKYLIGTQMNRNHERMGAIMGSIIDAYVTKNDEIEIIFTFAKTVYKKDYQYALDLIKKDKLTVSFELMVDDKDVEQIGANRRLTKVEFDGVGLLFALKPAYKNAHVLETAIKIIEEAFNQEDKKLIYASAKDITKKWTRIGELIEKALTENEKGDNKMDDKARNALLAKFKEEVIAELGEEAVKEWSTEQWEAELEKRASVEEKTDSKTTEASDKKAEESEDKKKEEPKKEEAKEEEPKKEEAKEEEPKKEEAKEEEPKKEEEKAEKTVTKVEQKVVSESTYDTDTGDEVTNTKSERKVTRDGKVVVEEKVESEVTYNYAQMEAVKAEYEKTITAKDEEIKFLKENATKVVEIRAELGDFVKDLSDSDLLDDNKLETARLRKRVDELEAEKKPVEKANEEPKKEEPKKEEPKKEDLIATDNKNAEDEDETPDDRVGEFLKSKYGNK